MRLCHGNFGQFHLSAFQTGGCAVNNETVKARSTSRADAITPAARRITTCPNKKAVPHQRHGLLLFQPLHHTAAASRF